jgi:hypothetical protein
MTRAYVIEKLSKECWDKLSRECGLTAANLESYLTVRAYIQIALVVGMEYFTKDMTEVIVINKNGSIQGQYKGITEAAKKLKIQQRDISAVLTGRQKTAGGYKFMRMDDYERIKNDELLTIIKP